MHQPASPRRIVFAAALLAIFMSSVEATIVATAMPTIVGDLGGLRLFSWVFGLYFLGQAVTIPIYGRLSDFFGRKPLIFIAIGVFLVSSIACGFSRTMTALIICRGFQGIGAGGIQPVATTIVGDIFTPVERAKYQGILSTTWALSSIVGPLIGAFLVAHFSWATVFWVNVPIGFACIVLLQRFYHEKLERRPRRIDYVGSLLLAVGVGALMVVLLVGSELGTLASIALALVAAVTLGILVRHELRDPEPMLPLHLWKIRFIALGAIGCFIVGAAIMSVNAYLPLYMQRALGASTFLVGVAIAAQSVFWTIGSVSSGRIMIRTSYRAVALTGACILMAGTLWMIAMDPARGPWWAVIGVGACGLGFGSCNLVFTISVQGSVERELRGAATASNLFMRNAGQTIGSAVQGSVFNAGLGREHVLSQQGIAAAGHAVFVVTGVLAIGLLTVTANLPSGRPGQHPVQPERT